MRTSSCSIPTGMSKPGRNALGEKEVNDEQRRASGVVLFCIVEIRAIYIMKVEAADGLCPVWS